MPVVMYEKNKILEVKSTMVTKFVAKKKKNAKITAPDLKWHIVKQATIESKTISFSIVSILWWFIAYLLCLA